MKAKAVAFRSTFFSFVQHFREKRPLVVHVSDVGREHVGEMVRDDWEGLVYSGIKGLY